MNDLYLIRHAECEDNVYDILPRDSSQIIQDGLNSITEIAKILDSAKIKKLLSSDVKRCQDTAKILGNYLNITPEITHNLREMKLPSSIVGVHESDPRAQAFFEFLDNHSDLGHVSWEDEERFTEFRSRVLNTLKYLTKINGNILAVTHAGFMRMTLALVKDGKNADIKTINALRKESKIRPLQVFKFTHEDLNNI